jgi:hypothetical protein
MLIVSLPELLDGLLNILHASGLAHLLGAVIRVTAGTVPITLEWFGVEGNLDAPLFGNTDEQITCHPEVIAHGDAFTRADLEFPLRGHDFSVNTADVDAGVKAGAIVGFYEIACKDLSGSCAIR